MITWEHGTIGDYLPPDSEPVEEWGPDVPCVHMVDDVNDLFIVVPYENAVYDRFGEEHAEIMIVAEARKLLHRAQQKHAREQERKAAETQAQEDSEEDLFHVFPHHGDDADTTAPRSED